MKRLPKYTPAEVRNDPYGFTYKEMSEVIGENEAKALYEELYKQLPRKKNLSMLVKNICKSSDTEKYVYELKDNKYIETVFIKRRDGGTVCVSTQVGCPVGCIFCESGRNGFVRNLTSSEIVQQIILLRRKVNRIVFMGMGEPLFNYDNLIKAIHILRDRYGLNFPTDGITIDRVNYELVYTAPLTKDMTLGDIWERFNIDHPADFKGHSLSVSDIVVLHQNDEDTAHYVDSIGFQQVPEFLQEQQTPVFDKLPPEQQQALSDTVQDTLQMLVDADKRIYGDVTGKTLEAIAAQGYSYKDGQLEKQQPEATPDSLLTGETVRTPRGNFHITDMSREQIEAAGFGFHHASEDGKYLIMGNGTQAYAIAAEQPQRDNPLKHVEDTIEQNDNNFDGLINNTPQTPTVADFEQRAKAGEAISVTDLAKAVKAEKREQPQKKPSILKKLDEYKKQAAQQPKDKQKEHKKDLEV